MKSTVKQLPSFNYQPLKLVIRKLMINDYRKKLQLKYLSFIEVMYQRKKLPSKLLLLIEALIVRFLSHLYEVPLI